ncbi:MAG TPA: hypothetical protein VFM37_15050, partial [Pseudonocardiaceae bacterium]|nr:hypothetical protein [Pseudonocardiaceae bacterium]
LRRTLLGVAPDPAGRLAALGAEPGEYDLFLADQLAEERYCAPMARPDVVIGPQGPRFVEFNVGSAVGGIVETSVVGAVLQRRWDDRFRCERPFDGIAAMFQGLGARSLAVVSLLADVTYDATSTRYFDLITGHLGRAGMAAEYFEPDQLPAGRFPFAMRHFTLVDARRLGVDIEPVRAAIEAGCLLVSTETGELIGNKKVLAWASEGRPWLTAADRELVDRYLPWTREVRDGPVWWRGGRHDLPALLLSRQAELVLKRGHGQCGLQVRIGRDTGAAQWATAVEEALAAGDSVVQEFVPAGRCRQRLFDLASGEAFDAVVAPVLSPYLFDGRTIGCMVRYFPSGQAGVIGCDGFGAQLNVAARAA